MMASEGNERKVTSGLLMSVIRTLTASKDVEERDREKENLEREFRESDSQLDRLVSQHHSDLTAVMQAFSRISVRLQTSKEKVKTVREKLLTCQKLFNCKRDELRKLWLESVENRHILDLLNRVEKSTQTPDQVKNFINSKNYSSATQLLVSSIEILETELESVEALKEVKTELYQKREVLCQLLIDELHERIYVKSCAEILARFQRGELIGKPAIDNTGSGNVSPRKMSIAETYSPSLLQISLNKRKSSTTLIDTVAGDGRITNGDDEDAKSHITTLIECLSSLNRLFDTVETLKNRADKELINIVRRAGKEVLAVRAQETKCSEAEKTSLCYPQKHANSSKTTKIPTLLKQTSDPNAAAESQLLVNLLELIFQQFRVVVSIHETVVLPTMRKMENQILASNKTNNSGDSTLPVYNMADIWSKLQSVLQLVIDLHLDISGSNLSNKSLQVSQESHHLHHHHHHHLHSSATLNSDINSFFAKKRPTLNMVNSLTKSKKSQLFRFDMSSHAISLNAYLQEQKDALLKETSERLSSQFTGRNSNSQFDSFNASLTESQLQCIVVTPKPEHIITMYSPLHRFMAEIDYELNLEEGNHCLLYSYVNTCAKVFINQTQIEIDKLLDVASKNLDPWKVIGEADLSKILQRNSTSSLIISTPSTTVVSTKTLSAVDESRILPNRPLLVSALIIEGIMQDLHRLMKTLHPYADDILSILCNCLASYREICNGAYRGIVQQEAEDKRIISATWAKDEDISRFLKSLPNWTALKAFKNQSGSAHASLTTSFSFDESPEEIRLRNMRESEILTSNLTQDTLIPNHEILSDVSQLRVLAQLQESTEWLANQIICLHAALPKHNQARHTETSNSMGSNQQHLLSVKESQQPSTGNSLEYGSFSERLLTEMKQNAKEIEELADTCLLALHLEVRVHCFFYLLRLSVHGSFSLSVDNQEPDAEVVQLNKDLTSIDEALSQTLQPWKLRYIFEGVGHLIASIIISSCSSLKRINQNGVKKMCRNIFSIQQTLSGITMNREVALDYARQYVELFYHTPEDILAMIVEQRPQFQAQEYSAAINLLHRSLPGRDSSMLEAAQKRLIDILNEVSVTV